MVVVTVALIALVVGVMAGYAASVPKQNDLTDQRDAAQAQLATMTTARDDLQAQKDQLQKDLDQAKSATGVAQDARDICSKAAEDGSALIARYDNLLGEVFTMFDQASEGYYNAQLGDHISQQSGEMVTESNTVEKELSDCEDSVKA